ncbi:MAG: NAD-dependent protein deacylase [Clostridiales Family XIII bacterium]|jgi:NAD-dependent deacetylase|nr:NAD-dependent protein deacylase [Clostridiales Family XIII bacterium]
MTEAEKLRALIDGARHIVFFGGAGVSTESGIPDFRSESGLYKAQSEYGHSPEEMISHSFFLREPDIFFHYYKENLIYPDARPNAAHLGLAQIERAGKDIKIVTQNIDGLHQAAGSSTVYELHGSVHRNTCTSCGAKYGLDYILDPAHCKWSDGRASDGDDSQSPSVPWCGRCGGLVRPDVVLYEEGLDGDTVSAATAAIAKADLLIVGGTSLVVYPAAGYLNYFRGDALVLINKSATSADGRASLRIRRPIGEVFSELGY